jgi:hypothetical protein
MCIVNERGSGESIGLSAVQRLVPKQALGDNLHAAEPKI